MKCSNYAYFYEDTSLKKGSKGAQKIAFSYCTPPTIITPNRVLPANLVAASPKKKGLPDKWGNKSGKASESDAQINDREGLETRLRALMNSDDRFDEISESSDFIKQPSTFQISQPPRPQPPNRIPRPPGSQDPSGTEDESPSSKGGSLLGSSALKDAVGSVMDTNALLNSSRNDTRQKLATVAEDVAFGSIEEQEAEARKTELHDNLNLVGTMSKMESNEYVQKRKKQRDPLISTRWWGKKKHHFLVPFPFIIGEKM